MKRFLVLYDYGQGGLWGYVSAASEQRILEKFPELQIVPEVPPWMDADYLNLLEGRQEAVNHPGDGLLGDIIKHRKSDA